MAGRLDEVTAPEGAEPAEETPAVQFAALRPAQPAAKATAAAAAE